MSRRGRTRTAAATPATPTPNTDEAQPLGALLVVEPDRQQRGEDRRGGDQDPGERRGDVLLTERDQQERAGDLDRADSGDDPEPSRAIR